jgi:hypothetical protein
LIEIVASNTSLEVVSPGSAEITLVPIKGDPGPQGPQGEVGPQGPPGESGTEALQSHIESSTPHPVYDDLPSLNLLFENGLV